MGLPAALLAISVTLSALAYVAAGDGMMMRHPALSLALWLLSIVLVIAAGGGPRASRRKTTWTRTDTVLVVGLTLLATPVRLIELDRIPWLLTGDEGSVGLAALEFLEGARNNIFGVSWFSFPSLFFLLPGASIGALGRTVFALRLPSALAGAATIPALYWASRPMFGRRVAVVASLYLALFHFHIHFSRLAINNAWDPLFLTLFIGFFWRAWGSGRRNGFMIAGLTLGLAQYFYVSSRALLIIVPIWLFVAGVRQPAHLRARLSGLGFMIGAATVVSLPLALFFLRNPNEFLAPLNRVLILGEPLAQESLRVGDPQWLLLWDQLHFTILGFFSAPFRLWYTGASMLQPVAALLFLGGLLLSLRRLRDLRFVWLWLVLLSGVVASTITDYVPSAQRFVHIAPTVAVFVALPICRLWAAAHVPRVRLRRVFPALAAAALLLASSQDAYFYFREYSPSRRFGDVGTEVANAVVGRVAATSPLHQAYLFGLPRMGVLTYSSIRYVLGDDILVDVPDPAQGEYTLDISGPTLLFFLPERVGELERILDAHPGGIREDVFRPNGELLFVSYYVGE